VQDTKDNLRQCKRNLLVQCPLWNLNQTLLFLARFKSKSPLLFGDNSEKRRHTNNIFVSILVYHEFLTLSEKLVMVSFGVMDNGDVSQRKEAKHAGKTISISSRKKITQGLEPSIKTMKFVQSCSASSLALEWLLSHDTEAGVRSAPSSPHGSSFHSNPP